MEVSGWFQSKVTLPSGNKSNLIRLGETPRLSGHFGREKNLLGVGGIDPPFLDHSLVITRIVLSRFVFHLSMTN